MVIDSFMPLSRRGESNTYCKSLRINGAETIINQATSLQQIRVNLVHSSRYYKINCESYWRHSTIEFRQHSGTIEYAKISNWILFLARLINFSKTSKLQNVESIDSLAEFLNEDLVNYFKQRQQQLS